MVVKEAANTLITVTRNTPTTRKSFVQLALRPLFFICLCGRSHVWKEEDQGIN